MFAKQFDESGILAAGERPEYSAEQMAEINKIIDENLARKHAREEVEREKRRAEEEYARAHQDEI
jgi:pyruvate kinase